MSREIQIQVDEGYPTAKTLRRLRIMHVYFGVALVAGLIVLFIIYG